MKLKMTEQQIINEECTADTNTKPKTKKPRKESRKRKLETVTDDNLDESVGETGIKKVKKKKKSKESGTKSIKKKDDSNVTEDVKMSPLCADNDDKDELTVTVEELLEGDFSNYRISKKTQKALRDRQISSLFPVQTSTFDWIYDGHDVVTQARTGTGKTLAFSLPIVEKLTQSGLSDTTKMRGRPPKVIVMVPTRELANQVARDIQSITDQLTVVCIYGGTPYFPQEKALRDGVDVVVGTPGRIIDLLKKGHLVTLAIKHVILDEVDRMLDMGFADSVDQVLQKSYSADSPENNPQTLLFSATVPPWVHQTAKKYMTRAKYKTVCLVGANESQAATTVQHLAIRSSYQDRAATIGSVLQVYSGKHGRAMIFCQKKRDADELAVSPSIKQETHVLHGDIPQEKREMVLQGFREGKYSSLVTTDVAARGLDIPEVDLVIQCSPPQDVDSYIHRSGRTGRAGRSGTCVCFFKPQEENDLKWVERKAGLKFKRVGAPTADDIITAAANDAARSLEDIGPETRGHFTQPAEELVNKMGAIEALSAALAVISGNTEIIERSLLSSQEGYTTYLFRTTQEMNRVGYCWRSLERCLPENVKESIKGMRFCQDKMGCVFDVPNQFIDLVDSHWQDGRWDSLSRAKQLPELLETVTSRTNNNYQNRGNNGYQNGYRGGRGHFNGNRGHRRGR